MADDPRKAETLDDAAKNPDGTYNGARALSWMSEALHPGAGISEDEVRRIAEKVQEFKQGGGNLDELSRLIADKRKEILSKAPPDSPLHNNWGADRWR